MIFSISKTCFFSTKQNENNIETAKLLNQMNQTDPTVLTVAIELRSKGSKLESLESLECCTNITHIGSNKLCIGRIGCIGYVTCVRKRKRLCQKSNKTNKMHIFISCIFMNPHEFTEFIEFYFDIFE